jgi:hypothetical protein
MIAPEHVDRALPELLDPRRREYGFPKDMPQPKAANRGVGRAQQ